MTNALIQALTDIKDAIDNLQPADSGTAPPQQVLQCLGVVDNSRVNDQLPLDIPLADETPPDGFADWSTYISYKCKAAFWIWDGINQQAAQFMSYAGLLKTVKDYAEGLSGLAFALGIELPVISWATLASALVAIQAISDTALAELSYFIDQWTTDRDAIICALMQSDDAQAACTALGGYLDAAVAAIAWPIDLIPYAAELGELLSDITISWQVNSLVNVLFSDSVLPESTYLCACEQNVWHFTLDDEGWAFVDQSTGGNGASGVWDDDPGGADPSDIDPGRLTCEVTRVGAGGVAQGCWSFTFAGIHPIAHTGDTFQIDVWHDMVGAGNTLHYGIEYTDLSVDNINVGLLPIWQTKDVHVTAPNDGKTVRRLYLTADNEFLASTHQWAFDSAHWIPF